MQFYVVHIILIAFTTITVRVYSDTANNSPQESTVLKVDGLTISKEVLKNISQQLSDGIGAREMQNSYKNEHLFQNKIEERRPFITYPSYHHHEHHWGPYFEAESGGSKRIDKTQQITGHIGSESLISCRVGMLKDKTVMWLRRNSDVVELLTVGNAPYSGDSRINVKFQYPNNWRLSINPTKKEDSGLYMCQISTHPPRAILANLTVLAPILSINGEQGHTMKDRFYKAGSEIELICEINNEFISNLTPVNSRRIVTTSVTPLITPEVMTVPTTTVNILEYLVNKSWSVEPVKTITQKYEVTTEPTVSTYESTTTSVLNTVNNIYGLLWKKNDTILSDGVDVSNLSTSFVVMSASQNDTALYTCQLGEKASVSVLVHILIGENQAAIHDDTWNKSSHIVCKYQILIIIVSTSMLFYR